jgi:hypothetical protein
MPPTPIVRRGKQGHFWDKGLEGVSHHAIIPNGNTVGDLRSIWPRLSEDERRLFMVVARSYLAALMPDFRYRQTTALLDVGGHAFRAMGRQPIEIGWRTVFGEEDEGERGEGEEKDERQMLPPLRDGEVVGLSEPKQDSLDGAARCRRALGSYEKGSVAWRGILRWWRAQNSYGRCRSWRVRSVGTRRIGRGRSCCR